MNVWVFNFCMLLGWALVSVGAYLLNQAAGLIVCGVLLLVISLLLARVFGIGRPRPVVRGDG
jgi:hypothetical protein